MWGLNRYDRPSWSTGFFIACACVIAAVGGIVSFKEGKKIKLVEGVNPSPAVAEALEKMQRQKEQQQQQGGLELANTNSTVDFAVRPDDKGRIRV
jgi:thioredoxin-like negative regulator of GroEL